MDLIIYAHYDCNYSLHIKEVSDASSHGSLKLTQDEYYDYVENFNTFVEWQNRIREAMK